VASGAPQRGVRGSVPGAADTEVDAVWWSATSVLNCSASDGVVGQHHPAGTHADRRRRGCDVAIITAGAELAIPGMLWCSAIQ
jgi:hypothetical protein